MFEQHVENLSGQGLPRNTLVSKSENFLRARISSPGKSERCCEKYASAGPATSSSTRAISRSKIISTVRDSPLGLLRVSFLRSQSLYTFYLDKALFSSILNFYTERIDMLKICVICGKTQVAGKSIVHKGLAKKKGGTGKKVTRSTARTFHPNLQKIRILLNNRRQKVYVCTKCIKKGRLQKV